MTGLLTRARRTESAAAREALLRTRGALQWTIRGHFVRARTIRDYLAREPEPKLHIGAGPHRLHGWLNTDLIAGDAYLDLSRRLPFPDASFAYVFGEHVIEHLTERTGTALLGELRRVLRTDGVARLTTPDLRKVIAIYEDRNPVIGRAEYARFLDAATGRRHERPCQILNDYLRLWGHRWIYDEDDLVARLHEAGFRDATRHESGMSANPVLRGLERHGGEPWVNRAEAMCVEARA
jgi:predicted SAM-dependent methyltransferase